MYLSHSCEPIRQRRCAAGDVGQTLDHAAEFDTPFEPVRESAEIEAQVFFPDGIVGPMRSILDDPEHRVGPGELRRLDAARAAFSSEARARTGLDERPEAMQTILGDFSFRRQMHLCPASNRLTAKSGDWRHAHGQRAPIGTASDRCDKRRFAVSTATALPAPAFSTPVGVVDLDRTRQGLAVVSLAHSLNQLLLEQPGGVVLNTKMASKGHSRHSGFALGEQENRQKPGRQRQFGAVKYCPGRQRRFDDGSDDIGTPCAT